MYTVYLQILERFMEAIWGKARYSTGFHTPTQVVGDRTNAVIAQMLYCTLIGTNDDNNWIQILSFIESAINYLRNQSTGYSPFVSMSGTTCSTRYFNQGE